MLACDVYTCVGCEFEFATELTTILLAVEVFDDIDYIYVCVYLYVSSEIEVKNINVIGKSDKTGEIVGYLGDFNEYEIFY